MHFVCKLCKTRKVIFVNCLLLLINTLFITLYVCHNRQVEQYFLPDMSAAQKDALVNLMRVFHETLTAAEITYFLHGGTLIGSWRHHGPIPWDDDLDVVVAGSDEWRVYDALVALKPHYVLYAHRGFRGKPPWKLYDNRSLTSHTYYHQTYRWPFLDIYQYEENATHVWNDWPVTETFCWSKTHVFPLYNRPFAGLRLPAPCNPLAVLSDTFNMSGCQSRVNNHLRETLEIQLKPRRVDCQLLYHLLPFVRKRQLDEQSGELTETLGIGEWTLSVERFTAPSKSCNSL